MISPISPYAYPNASRSTKTARSIGDNVSITSSIAVETESASATFSAMSGLVSIGSGSHGPT
jgi:hypothetical protein